jgi:hypothetical protein
MVNKFSPVGFIIYFSALSFNITLVSSLSVLTSVILTLVLNGLKFTLGRLGHLFIIINF